LLDVPARDFELVIACRSRRLVVYFPPNPDRILAIRQAEYAQYRARIGSLLRATDIVVDFNTPAYAGMRGDYENFEDGVHPSRTGARLVVLELGRAVAVADSTVEASAR
jgi:hypothetical protein